MAILPRDIFARGGNEALQVNPPVNVQYHISTNGSDWLWAVFSIFAVVDIGFAIWTLLQPKGHRVFHQLAVIILTVSSIAYFAQASNLGYTSIPTEFSHKGVAEGTTRQIWYARYIDWVITMPLLLLVLLLTTGEPLSEIVTTCFFGIEFWVALLIGALVRSTYKWGFFVFALCGLAYWWAQLFGGARTTSPNSTLRRNGLISGSWLAFLFVLYPIAWGLSEGGNVIKPTSEMIFYGILDLLAKPLLLGYHLFSLRDVDFGELGLSSGKHSVGEDAISTSRHLPPVARGISTDPEKASRTKSGMKMFTRAGRHDDVRPAVHTTTTTDTHAPPRPSEATVVSQEESDIGHSPHTAT